jgi:hypothetical protein
LSIQIYEANQDLNHTRYTRRAVRSVRFADEAGSKDLVEYHEPVPEIESAHTTENDDKQNARPPEGSPSYYADLKQELKQWMHTENTQWSAPQEPSLATAAAQLPMQTPLSALTPPTPDLTPNVSLKIDMVRDAARTPDVTKQTRTHTDIDANVVPSKLSNDEADNIMNSGNLGGGLSAWDGQGDTYGAAL